MDITAGPQRDDISAIAKHLRAHEVADLRLVSRTFRNAVDTDVPPDAIRMVSRNEQRKILDEFIGALAGDHGRIRQPLERIAERIAAAAPPGPATQQYLCAISPDMFEELQYGEIARHLVPLAPTRKIEEVLDYYLSHPDEAAKFVGLSHLGAVAEHLPPAAINELQAHIGPEPDALILAGIAQLHRGFTGDDWSARSLRDAVIAGVYNANPAEPQTSQLRALLGAFWDHLSSDQRRTVAQAATDALQQTINGVHLNKLAGGGLLDITTSFRIVDTRETARALGARIIAFPTADKAEFLQALHGLPDLANIATVHALGPQFHKAFPDVFAQARVRADNALQFGLSLAALPLAMRPHEPFGVPRRLRARDGLQLTASPSFDSSELFATKQPQAGAAPPDMQPLPDVPGMEINQAVQSELPRILRDWKSLDEYEPRKRINIVDTLAATNRLGSPSEVFYTGMGAPIQARLIDHVKTLLDRDTSNISLPPLQQFSPKALADALDGGQFERWRTVNNRQRFIERRNYAALSLNENLPQIQRSTTPSVAELNEAANYGLYDQITKAATIRQSGPGNSARTASLLNALKSAAPNDAAGI